MRAATVFRIVGLLMLAYGVGTLILMQTDHRQCQLYSQPDRGGFPVVRRVEFVTCQNSLIQEAAIGCIES